MTRRIYTTAPDGYPVCMLDSCPKAAKCLHRIAFDQLRTKSDYMRLINPDRCTADAVCPHYRSGDPVSYARGFTGFQSRMYPQQYERFKAALVRHFGHTSYYIRRRGEVPLSPKEQAVVLKALGKAGVTEEMEFDSYEDAVCWYD